MSSVVLTSSSSSRPCSPMRRTVSCLLGAELAEHLVDEQVA